MSLRKRPPTEALSWNIVKAVSGGSLACGAFEQLVDECLVGLRLFGGQAAELSKKARSDADSDQLLGVSSHGPAHTARAAKLLVSGFRNVGKVQPAIRHMLDALCALPGAR